MLEGRSVTAVPVAKDDADELPVGNGALDAVPVAAACLRIGSRLIISSTGAALAKMAVKPRRVATKDVFILSVFLCVGVDALVRDFGFVVTVKRETLS